MKNVITTEKIPIKLWLGDMEENALAQAKNLANLPFAFKHIAIMPDSHAGYGMPIGGVLATKNVIIPNAVGVDIGCGMCAVKTSLTDIDTDTLKKIWGKICETVPVGFKKHTSQQNQSLMPDKRNDGKIVNQEWEKALYSLGTLGGGNHFIEIQKGDDGYIWIMIHSGSRNLGKQVADYYNKLAIELNKKWHASVPKEWELAFLSIDSEEAQDYVCEMNYCVDFALTNRKVMMERIKAIFDSQTKKDVAYDNMINIAHNYARLENHFGQNVWVHRKGATSARQGEMGLIPGSQGSKSYVISGKGHPEAFNSCSHGAGRQMGRKQAERNLNLKEETTKLDSQNIIHSIRHVSDLDEAPGAYKPIEDVMRNQEDLVDVLVELTPLAVVKG